MGMLMTTVDAFFFSTHCLIIATRCLSFQSIPEGSVIVFKILYHPRVCGERIKWEKNGDHLFTVITHSVEN